MITIKQQNSNSHSKIQILPCQTTYKGKANINTYFTPNIQQEGDDLTSSLVGRKVKGVKKEVESINLNYCQCSYDEDNKSYIMFPIKEVIQWNKDYVLKDSDSRLTKLEQWINIQNILHS